MLPATYNLQHTTKYTVARQPMSLTWFPFNAGNQTGNLYSD